MALAGISIGSAAIVALLQIGLITEQQILAQLRGAGADLMVVEPIQESQSPTPPPADVDLEDWLEAYPEVEIAALLQSLYAPIIVDNQQVHVELLETGDAFPQIAGLKLGHGTLRELATVSNRAAVGPGTFLSDEEKVLPLSVGDIVQIGFDGYRIVGLLDGDAHNSMIGVDYGRSLLLPRKAFKRITRQAVYWRVIIKVLPDVDKSRFEQVLASDFRENLGLGVSTFYAENLIQAEKEQQRRLTQLLGAIGAISMVVGSIGVANVMLASVSERRSEIGLRMAIGAAPRDILLLFLVEAMVLCLVGGILGTGIAVASSNIYAALTLGETIISYGVILLGVAVSALSGIGAGYWPARRSSRLDPIRALQSN